MRAIQEVPDEIPCQWKIEGRLQVQSRQRHACGQIRNRAGCQKKQDRSHDHNGRASDWRAIQNARKKCCDKGLGNPPTASRTPKITPLFFDIDTAAQMINAAVAGIHAFRRGGCSELLDAATPVNVVSRLMRHSCCKVTLNNLPTRCVILRAPDRKGYQRKSGKISSIGVRFRNGVNSVRNCLKKGNLAEACGSRTHHPGREGQDQWL
jgi:hypothetical protein